ncbi:gag-pol polyprotein [Tanacetum coccineum]
MRSETAGEFDWTNEAEESLQRIKRKLNKLQPLAISKEREVLMICLRQRNETISFVLFVEREGIQIPVSYVSRLLQGTEICYTSAEKMVQALIHTTRSLRAIFRKHKVNVVTDGPMEEILKLTGREGRLAKWAAEVRTYDIAYTQRKEVEGSVVKKFFGQGEQVQETPDANEGERKEIIEEGSGVRIILLAGLAASVSKGMEDLHVFMDSPKLIAQSEGNNTPATEQEKKYKKEIMKATTPFHRLQITHLLKILNPPSGSINRVGNHKVGISQSESIGRYQNKTIGGGDKQQQEGKSVKQCTRSKDKLQLGS